jgi:hypothetical protein
VAVRVRVRIKMSEMLVVWRIVDVDGGMLPFFHSFGTLNS